MRKINAGSLSQTQKNLFLLVFSKHDSFDLVKKDYQIQNLNIFVYIYMIMIVYCQSINDD